MFRGPWVTGMKERKVENEEDGDGRERIRPEKHQKENERRRERVGLFISLCFPSCDRAPF